MKIKVISVSKPAKDYEALAEDYLRRLRHYCTLDNSVVRPRKLEDEALQRRSDSTQILGLLKPEDYLVLLDERGNLFSSVDFSKWIAQLQHQNLKSIAFVIGGAFGVDESISSRANLRVSLSPMTLPHQLARILFFEQLYRAFTILNHQPYHHS